MNNLDKHYLVLGLQHGATQEEIRSAFRRMTVKYHPDKDPSLDAQMKFHEARQAYDALRNATGAGTRDNNSTGFTNAEKDTANSDEFNDAVRAHPEFKNFYRNYAAEKLRREPKGEPIEIEPDEFLDFPIHDYFSRWQLVLLTVIGSIVATFIAMRYLNAGLFPPESSVRLFGHTAVFVLVSWLIFWYIRFSDPSQAMLLDSTVITFLLAVAYICWIHFYAFQPEFDQFLRTSWGAGNAVIVNAFYFFCIFKITTNSLEGEGFRAAFIGFFRAFFRTVFSRD